MTTLRESEGNRESEGAREQEERERLGGGSKQSLLEWVSPTWLLRGNCGVELRQNVNSWII